MTISKSVKVTVVASLFVVAIGGVFYLNQPESANATQSTDDAYIQADFTIVSPQIAGKISQVLVDDNDVVKQGDVHFTEPGYIHLSKKVASEIAAQLPK